MARTCWWLNLVIVLISSLGRSYAALNSAEVDALQIIKSDWNLNASTWTTGEDPCIGTWEGVKCDGSGTHVIYLYYSTPSFVEKNCAVEPSLKFSWIPDDENFTTMGLSGNIPDAVANLTFLEHLDVSNWDPRSYNISGSWNYVRGDLAPLAKLTSLISLNISWNILVPTGTDTVTGGPIPDVLYGLTNLIELRIANSYFSGSFSSKITNLRQLQILYAGNNSFTGDLPKELGNLTSLRELTMWGNHWSSQIPAEFGKLVNLEYLNLHDNELWGGLPSELGALTHMKYLHLYSNEFTGRIPDSWKSMTELNSFRLSKNYISGDLPTWIWTLQNLTNLQVDDNEFTGSIPTTWSSQILTMRLTCNYLSGNTPTTNASIDLEVANNCFPNYVSPRKSTECLTRLSCTQYLNSVGSGTCPSCPQSQKRYNSTLCTCKPAADKTNVAPIVGSVIGAFVGAMIIIGITFAILRRRKKDCAQLVDGRFDPALAKELNDPNWQAPPGVQRFKLSELSNATGGFDEAHEIGVGGFGKVFIGNFRDGGTLAIKRASGLLSSNQGLAEFRNEVLLLSRLHHRNLVRLQGFCEECGLQILVYEFMRQGNLHAHLFRPEGSRNHLNWYNRLDIAVGVANGLDYLHSFANPPVIHRDVKPSNILLDDNLMAKVADFGISRATDESATHISTKPAGTAGYFDPQYFIRRQLTTASDVYGYGVVLLELVTGQKAIDHERVTEFNLVEWARPRFRSRGLEEIMDPKLGDSYPKNIYHDMAKLALECTLFNKDDRPSMKAVLNVLVPHLNNCQPPAISQDHSDTRIPMDWRDPSQSSSSNNFTGTRHNTYASSSDPSGITNIEMTYTLLPR